MSRSLWPHGLQHVRLPCPSPSPGVCSNLRPLSRWCHPAISSPSPSTFNLSQHQDLFQWIGFLHQVAKICESFQWIFRTDSFRIDWFDILAVQGTFKIYLQHHSLKESIFQDSVFFMAQLSHPYMNVFGFPGWFCFTYSSFSSWSQ